MTIKCEKPVKRSPLKQKPLNNPGDSLQNSFDNLVLDKGLFWLAMPMGMIVFAAVEWYQYIFKVPPMPIIMTITALGFVVMAFFKIKALIPKIKSIRQGIDGEKVVGQYLESLRAQGYQVFHDLTEDGYNIDHVLIGPTGIYAIETKTISKPTDHDAVVAYDGQGLLVDGLTPDRDPLKQVEANAGRVKQIIESCTGKTIKVRGVVIYPGWYITKTCRSPKIWVVNENLLAAYLDHEDDCLSDQDIRSYAAILGNHIRSRAGVA